ncbi:MAG: glycosyltransferase family 4 protein [Gemmatimonadota bacterium]
MPTAMSAMRIGLIAPEFKEFGGMAEFGRQLAAGLAPRDDVVVFTRHDAPGDDERWQGIPLRRVLTRELSADLAVLADHRCDVWFACNAGYAAAASHLSAPLAIYVNGNDLLRPWVHRSRPWVRHIETSTVVWRIVPALRERLRVRDLRKGLADAAGILANSANTAAILARLYPGNEGHTSVVHPGVAEDFFQERPERRPGPLRLLTVTRLDRGTPRKNVDGVLRALALLPSDLDVRYTVVGDGKDRSRVENLAEELGVAGRTRFEGFVGRERLKELYADADLFVLASRASDTDVEGFGIVYMEASAAGTPVICSRTGGSIDAVVDGENGLLIRDSEPTTIAAALGIYADHPGQFDPERVRAVAEGFRWPAIAARVRTILERCAAGRGER